MQILLIQEEVVLATEQKQDIRHSFPGVVALRVVALRAMALSAVLLMTGCIWSRVRVNDWDLPQKAARVTEGETKAEELESIMGSKPSVVQNLKSGKKAHVYVFGDTKTKGLNLIFFQVIKSNSAFDTAMFLEDQNGVIEDVMISNNSEDLPWEWWAFGDS